MSSMNDERGSVSLYALLVLVPIVLFLGLMADLARYRSADRWAEQQTKAAVRSVLSAYDRKLRDEYGLFGLAATEREWETMALLPFAPGTDGGRSGFSIVSPRLSDLRIDPVYTLADHRFFRRQILEEMKVKGPVEFTRRVYDNWKDRAPEMEEAANAAEWSEEVEKLLQKRERELRNAFRCVERMDALFGQGYAILSLPPPIPPEPAEGEAVPIEPINPYTGALAIFTSLQAELDKLAGHLRAAEEAENGIRSAMEDEAGDLLEGVPLYGAGFYSAYILDAGYPVSRFGAAASKASADPYGSIDLSFDGEFRSFHARMSGEEQRRRAMFDEVERQKDERRKETRQQLDKAKERLAAQSCSAEEEALHERLTLLYADYLAFNTADEPGAMAPDPVSGLHQEPDQLQKNALILLRDLSGILATIRDEVLVNEYAMLYFSNTVTGLDGQPLLESVKGHPLRQEAEYVLYGLSSCSANKAAAYTEMFAVRFAIRTVEALVDVRKAATGSPLLVLLTAAAEGAARAFMDMERLLDGEVIPLFQRQPNLRMGYADYLRVFLALHSNETKKMARMQALVELNTGIDLAERPVYVKAVSRSEVALHMFPAVAKKWAPDAEEGERRSVIVVKQAEMAY